MRPEDNSACRPILPSTCQGSVRRDAALVAFPDRTAGSHSVAEAETVVRLQLEPGAVSWPLVPQRINPVAG